MTFSHEQLWTIALDARCRTIVRQLQAAGHRPIMLKGATIASWLYLDPSIRVYQDLDILVPPADRDDVIATLRKSGFVPLLDDPMLATSSTEEQPLRDADGVVIDLHTGLKGVRLDQGAAWQILDAMTVPWDWAGFEVRALAPPARALHLALHVAQRGLAGPR